MQHGKGRKTFYKRLAVEDQNIELYYVFAHMFFIIVMGVIIITVITVINGRGVLNCKYNKQGRRKAFSKDYNNMIHPCKWTMASLPLTLLLCAFKELIKIYGYIDLDV